MQSNCETAEIGNQQFMDCSSSVLPVFNPQKQNQNHFLQQFHQPQPFSHLSQIAQPIPITHDLFQRQNHLQFQALLLQQQQQEQQEQQEESRLPWQPSPLSFKLGLSENSGPHYLGFKNWQTQEYYGIIREPMCSWKPLDTVVPDTTNNRQRQEEGERSRDLEEKHRLYGELEAIYNLAKMGEGNQNHTGSGSALTGENCLKNVGFPVVFGDSNGLNAAPVDTFRADNRSEDSIGEEVLVRKIQKRKRKRKMKEQLSSMTRFFENLVKQVVDHQENLHKKYLEVIEKMEKERREREDAWRCQAEENHKREAMAKLHEQAIASSREALIVSYIEKITGQRVDLPPRETPLLLQPDNLRPETAEELTPSKADHTNSRWPQNEVEALILVRSSVESKFAELGSKGHVWEEVSALMASMGYQKSARRCKQKWENINKYFRKTKDAEKKRPLQSKTCSYFSQLGQLYSKTPTVPSSSSSASMDVSVQRQGYSDLLEAFIAGRETGVTHNQPNGNFESSEMGSSRLDFNGIGDGKLEHVQGDCGKEKENDEDDENMDERKDTDGDDSDE